MATRRAGGRLGRAARHDAGSSARSGKVRRPTGYGPLSDAALERVFATLAKRIVPRTELRYDSPYELLVAVVLSAQATDRSVNAATGRLFPVANTPQAMVALGEDGLRQHIRTIGLFNAKARNIIALSAQLIAKHGGAVPHDRASLEALPGVGRKTANVVLNVVFGEPTIAVDTHVQRVANRLGIVHTTVPHKTEEVLMARVPKAYLHDAHHYLILHGRYCCTARAPRCPTCPVRTWCCYEAKTSGKD